MDQLSRPAVDYSDIFLADTGQEEGQTFSKYLMGLICFIKHLELILVTMYIHRYHSLAN